MKCIEIPHFLLLNFDHLSLISRIWGAKTMKLQVRPLRSCHVWSEWCDNFWLWDAQRSRHMVWFMAGKGKLSTWKLSQLGQLRPITAIFCTFWKPPWHWSALYCDCDDIAEAIFLLGIGKAVKAAVATVKPEAASELKVENLELSLSRQSCWKTRRKKGTSSWVAESLVQGQGHISLVNINWKGMETGQTFWFALEQTGVARCWHTAGALLLWTCRNCFYNSFSPFVLRTMVLLMVTLLSSWWQRPRQLGVTLLEKQLMGFLFKDFISRKPRLLLLLHLRWRQRRRLQHRQSQPEQKIWKRSQELEETLGEQILYAVFFTQADFF